MQSKVKEYLKRRIEEASLICDCGEKDSWIHLCQSEKPFFSGGFLVITYFFRKNSKLIEQVLFPQRVFPTSWSKCRAMINLMIWAVPS
jgi:hypothetical protein